MRVLVTTAPLEGHLHPLVAQAWALRTAGHDVLVTAPEQFGDVVTATGLTFAADCGPLGFEEFMRRDRDGRPVEPLADPRARRRQSGRAWGRLAARTLPGVLELLDRWEPDLLLCDPLEPAGPVAATVRSVPWVEPGVNFRGAAGARDLLEAATEELTPELQALGTTGPRPADLVLDVCPPSMRLPVSHPPHRPAALAVRYVPHAGSVPRPLSPPLSRPRAAGRPRVLLTFGTLLPTHSALDVGTRLSATARALAERGTDVHIAVDDAVAARWGDLPDGISAGRVPLPEALQHSDVLVSHAGPGSVLAGLVHGTPQLCLPFTSDQFDNTEHVVARGTGRGLQPAEATPGAVAAAVEELLTTPGYRRAAAEVAAEVAASPSPADVVPALERLAVSAVVSAVGVG